MSSITTTIPAGPMRQWCLGSFDSAPHDPSWDLCLRDIEPNHEADYMTICCDGEVINEHLDIWKDLGRNRTLDLRDMVCCRQAGRNPGGLLPLPQDYTHCASGDPTPLASMAATNTDNAQNFAVTYISASGGTADWTTQSTPTCLWANTKNISGTTEVMLPAAKITTLPPESGEAYSTSAEDSLTASRTASSSSGTLTAASASTSAAQNVASRFGTATWSRSSRLLLVFVATCHFGL